MFREGLEEAEGAAWCPREKEARRRGRGGG